MDTYTPLCAGGFHSERDHYGPDRAHSPDVGFTSGQANRSGGQPPFSRLVFGYTITCAPEGSASGVVLTGPGFERVAGQSGINQIGSSGTTVMLVQPTRRFRALVSSRTGCYMINVACRTEPVELNERINDARFCNVFYGARFE